MSDEMIIQPFPRLLKWILEEYHEQDSIFGIHKSLFFRPKPDSPYATELFGHYLATPVGPAAGPHTQLTQNILCAWLSGGRFIELKTVQIMDELDIPRPCIDMEDEGYNVEWSQELKLDESAEEYIKAWVLIHILRRLFGFEHLPFGTIFNMSVGYNLEGIQQPPMVAFMDQMADASQEIAEIRALLRSDFPQFADIEIPGQLTDNVTLSTMHGCPPDEIEQIAHYLLTERQLHTTVKLNPTLLGRETVMGILHDALHYTEIDIPETVFEHDLKYDRALRLVRSLQAVAAEQDLAFGIKLTNTLAMANHRKELPGEEMYMSGRALYPITVSLFYRFAQDLRGQINVSYSGGADALNVATLLAAGALPITVASDLLKPGGYSRMLQYVENIETAMQAQEADSLASFAEDRLNNLEWAAIDALRDPRYKKTYFPYGLPKVEDSLDLFDCIVAPCMFPCAVFQDVPEYAWLIAQGEVDRALGVVLARNPLPGVTGYVCTRLCETRCTRNDYEEPVAIRALKRYAFEKGDVSMLASPPTGHRVAIVGSGPSGLAAAAFLALNGVKATIYEAKDHVGGMMRLVPVFRLPWSVIQEDADRITDLGVEIKLSHPITEPPERLLDQNYDAVYVAAGFQRDAPLHIEGIDGPGVYSALDLLERARQGEQLELGTRALVIGGGDTAMDATRVAQRFTGNPVTIVYRRTRHEMPANEEELEGAFEENNPLEELASPVRVIRRDGRIVALECIRNRLGEPGPDGRRSPVPVQGSEFEIETDTVIVAIGQKPALTFLEGSTITRHPNGSIAVDPVSGQAGLPGVYAGGDVVVGPESIIAACADGRRAAEGICSQLGIDFAHYEADPAALTQEEIIQVKHARARKEPQVRPTMMPVPQRTGFALIEESYTEAMARREGLRCLQCTTLCDKCVEVCPNRANLTFLIDPVDLQVPLIICHDDQLLVSGSERFVVAQDRQIIHIADFCNECGNCTTFCVHHGRPFAEKPRLYLEYPEFEAEQDNAFLIDGRTIRRRENGQETQLALDADGGLAYETPHLRASLSTELGVVELHLKQAFEGHWSLKDAAEMLVIYRGVTSSLPLPL